MQDRPGADIFVPALALFMRERALPQLQGHARFEARVAANVLGILQREQQWGAPFAQAQRARLEALLETKAALYELNQILCQRIRDGKLSLRDPRLRVHLRKCAMGKLAIDQPTYASYQRARAAGWAEEDGFTDSASSGKTRS